MIAGKNFVLSIIFAVLLLAILQLDYAYGQVSEKSSEDNRENCMNNLQKKSFGKPIVYFQTDNDRYLTGSKIIVNGKIFGPCGEPLSIPVTIELFKIDPDKSFEEQDTNENRIVKQSKLSDSGEFRQIIELRKHEHSDFLIKASATHENVNTTSYQPIEIRDFAQTGVGIGIYAEIFFIGCLLTLIYAQLRHGWSLPSIEPFRFALLTLCSVIPIIIFIAADVQLGQDSAFGVVVKHFDEPIKEITFERLTEATGTVEVSQQENIISKFEWVINVGGSPLDNYSTGIQIPVFVLIFGLVGGYLRFLRKTSQGWIKEKIVESVEFFSRNDKVLPKWARKTASELIANRYFITTPAGEVFNRIATCHVCNMHKDFIQAADEQNKGEPICPECFRKKSKSCNYCKLHVIKAIKELEMDLMEKENLIKEIEIKIENYKNELKTDEEDNEIKNKIRAENNELVKLRRERKELKIKLEPLYIERTTEIGKNGRCQNLLLDKDLESLESLEIDDKDRKKSSLSFGLWKKEFLGTKKFDKCNRLNLDNKHQILRWKNKSKLQKRFYPQVSRAIFNNSMEDLALIFLPPVLAFALYFVLLQAGITAQENMPTIAAVSLAIGLITKEALQRLETLGKNFLVGDKSVSGDEVEQMKNELGEYKKKDLKKLQDEIVTLSLEKTKREKELEKLRNHNMQDKSFKSKEQ